MFGNYSQKCYYQYISHSSLSIKQYKNVFTFDDILRGRVSGRRGRQEAGLAAEGGYAAPTDDVPVYDDAAPALGGYAAGDDAAALGGYSADDAAGSGDPALDMLQVNYSSICLSIYLRIFFSFFIYVLYTYLFFLSIYLYFLYKNLHPSILSLLTSLQPHSSSLKPSSCINSTW